MQRSPNSYANVVHKLFKSRLKGMHNSSTSYTKVVQKCSSHRPGAMHKSPEGYPTVVQKLCRRRSTAIAKVFQQLLKRRPAAMHNSSTMQKSSRSFQTSSRSYAQIVRICSKGRPKVMQLTCDVVPPWATENISMPRDEHHSARRGR
jgi:hypothetical protein